MSRAAQRRGYHLDSIARQVTEDDIKNFDVIVAMDGDNLQNLKNLSAGDSGHICKLGEFLPDAGAAPPGAPDPYYGDAEGFEDVLDLIENACPMLFDHCSELLAELNRWKNASRSNLRSQSKAV